MKKNVTVAAQPSQTSKVIAAVVASAPKSLTFTNETEALIEKLTEQKLQEIRQKEKDEEAAKEKAAKK